MSMHDSSAPPVTMRRKRRPGPPSLASSIFDRQMRGSAVTYPRRHLLSKFQCPQRNIFCLDHLSPRPWFVLQWSSRNPHILATAGESGEVCFINANQVVNGKQVDAHSFAVTKRWEAHQNSLFDLKWTDGDSKIITASGDRAVRLWDVQSASQPTLMQEFIGHCSSVKRIATMHEQPFVFASCGRDGVVFLWDTRTLGTSLGGVMRCRPVASIKHSGGGPAGTHPTSDVMFLKDDLVIASGGSSDGLVKLWDMRSMRSRNSQKRGVAPVCTFQPRGESFYRGRGVCGMAMDSTGTRMIVSLMDHKIYMYDTLHPEMGELGAFTGHTSGSYFIRAEFAPDGEHIISGSTDRRVYTWEVNNSNGVNMGEHNSSSNGTDGALSLVNDRPYVLSGHVNEVTCASWCPNDMTRLASCSDDGTLRIWDSLACNDSNDRRGSNVHNSNMDMTSVDTHAAFYSTPNGWGSGSGGFHDDSDDDLRPGTMRTNPNSLTPPPTGSEDHTPSPLLTPSRRSRLQRYPLRPGVAVEFSPRRSPRIQAQRSRQMAPRPTYAARTLFDLWSPPGPRGTVGKVVPPLSGIRKREPLVRRGRSEATPSKRGRKL